MMCDYNRIDDEIEQLFVDIACCEGNVGVAKLFSHLSLCIEKNLRYQLEEKTDGDKNDI